MVRTLATSLTAIAIATPIGALIGLLGPVFGSALIIGVVAAFLVLRSPLLALCTVLAVIYLLPFAALPIDIGFAPTFLDLVLGAAFLVWISRTVLHKDRELITAPPLGGVLIFAGLAIFSFIMGLRHAPLTATVLRRFVELLLAILSFILVLNIVRTRSQLFITTGIFVLGGFGASLVAVTLYFAPSGLSERALNALAVLRYPSGQVLRYIEDDPTKAMRAIGTSVDPNVLGGVLIVGTVLTLSLLLSAEKRWLQWALGVVAGTMVLGIILTYSRSAFVGLAAGLGLMVLLRRPRLMWLGLALLAVLMLLPPMQAYANRLIEGFRGDDLATQMRFGEYKDAFRLIRRHPWIGVGFSGTAEIDTYLGVSSVYLLIAEEMGLIGLAAFIVTMSIFLVHFLAQRRELDGDEPLKAVAYGAATGLFGSLVAGIADHYLFNLVFPHAATLLWMSLGLGAAALRIAKLPPDEQQGLKTCGDKRHWAIRALFPDVPRSYRTTAGARVKELTN